MYKNELISRHDDPALNSRFSFTYHHSFCAIDCNSLSEAENLRQSHSSRLIDLLSQSTSDATKRAYQADLSHYEAFGGKIPSTAENLALYLAFQSQTHKPATIARRLAAISKAHQLKGLNDPTKSEIVKATIKGIRRSQGVVQHEAKPLLRDDLYSLLNAMGDRKIDIRDRALLLLGFAGGFRRSELVGLDVSDLEIVRQGMIITLRRSKTDQEGKGRKIGIPFGRGPWCPVLAMKAWLQLSEINSGALFRLINRHGKLENSRISGEA